MTMIVEWLVTQLVIYWQNSLRKIYRLRNQQQSLELRHLNDVDRCHTLISLFTLVMINEYFWRWYYERQQACFWTNHDRLATTASPSKREGPPRLFTAGTGLYISFCMEWERIRAPHELERGFEIRDLPPPTAMNSVLTTRPRPFPQH